MPDNDISAEQWNAALTKHLAPLLPIELLQESVDALTESIRHNDIQVQPSDVDLDLASLQDHALTLLLIEQLSPLIDDTPSSGQDSSASNSDFTLLASNTIDSLYAPPLEEAHNTREKHKECQLCEREMPLTVHHLIPRSTHAYFANNPHLLDPPRERSKTIKADLALVQAMVCRPCHSMIHDFVPNHRELAMRYASVERLLQREDVVKYVKWVRTQRVSDKSMGRGIRYRR